MPFGGIISQKTLVTELRGVTVDMKAPKILTPDQAKTLLTIVPAMCRPYLILGMYAGIRPEEIMRLDWSEISLETNTVKVDGKTRRRRIVNLEPKAAALLSGCPLRRGPVSPSLSTVKRFHKSARAALGLARWPQDLLRHTAASYLLALHRDAGRVATMLGNSASILLSHYHEPVTAADCNLFWSLASPTKYDQSILAVGVGPCQFFCDGQAHCQDKSKNDAPAQAPDQGARPA